MKENNGINTNVSVDSLNFKTTIDQNPNNIEITKNKILNTQKYGKFKISRDSDSG